MRRRAPGRFIAVSVAASIVSVGWVVAAGAGTPTPSKASSALPVTGSYAVMTVLSGSSLSHPVGNGSEPVSGPDDITDLGGMLFVGFQNGVGSMGEPAGSNTASTLVEFAPEGAVVHQWDLTGKIDGLGADPSGDRVVATVNEDGNSSLYSIKPKATPDAQVTHYAFTPSPLPHGGGTDAVSFYDGRILISASAPADSTHAAVYSVALQPATQTATYSSVFLDDASATDAVTGQDVTLALTDPDSNTVVPGSSPRFPGDFMLNSQGDLQQIYVHGLGSKQSLSVLNLSQAVDDTAWATDPSGVLYATDATHNAVDMISGPFRPGQVFVAVAPCNANGAPSPCPAPNYPANFLGSLDLTTGTVSSVTTTGTALVPKGLFFVTGG